MTSRPRLQFIVALVVPFLFVWSAFQFKEAHGPYWLGSNSDPEYAYLLNSLMLAEGRAPAHYHHPGTTLQALGALTLQATHRLVGLTTLREDVLRRPELYLDSIHRVLSALSFLLLTITGLLVLRGQGDWVSALLLQAAPFFSKESIACGSRVHPETLMLALVSVFAALLYRCMQSKSEEADRWAVFMGFVCGIALGTKVTFVPLLFIPFFVLRSTAAKIRYFLLATLTAAICTLPVLPRLWTILTWMSGLFLRSGHYGTGSVNPFRPGYWTGLSNLVLKNPAFGVQLAVGMMLVLGLWARRRTESEWTEPIRKLATGLLFATMLLWLLAARQSYHLPRYLLPATCLLSLMLVLLRDAWAKRGNPLHGKLWIVLILGLGILRGVDLQQEMENLRMKREDQGRTVAISTQRFPQSPKVYFFRSSSLQYALFFGNGHADFTYSRALYRIYPNSYFYNIWARVFSDFSQRIEISQLWQREPSFLLQGSNQWAVRRFRFPVDYVYQGRHESLYRIKATALHLLQQPAPGSTPESIQDESESPGPEQP